MSVAKSWSSTRPRIFIGSSNEAKPVAERLHSLLAEFARPRLWPNAFRLSQHFLDDVLRQARECEFGVFLMTADDLLTKREETHGVARDNVLFELGVFFGALGKERAFFVFSGENPPLLPSDLAGTTAGIYTGASPTELVDALRPVAVQIKDAITVASPVSPLGRREGETRHIMTSTISALSRAIPEARSEDIGAHLWWLDIDDGGTAERLTRVLRVRPGSSRPNNWPPWKRGEGVVGAAWEEDTTVSIDYGDPLLQAVASRGDFERLPATLRLAASYEGFLVGRRDFRAVWATPISAADGDLLGILSLNVDKDTTMSFPQLNAIVRPAVRDLAATVGVVASTP